MTEAIPTKYKGRQYRSRLEAKWAVFFDLAGFDFEYEPYDLNGWIPDFSIVGKTANPLLSAEEAAIRDPGQMLRNREMSPTEILVEIKPVRIEPFGQERRLESLTEHEILICGAAVLNRSYGPCIGWLYDQEQWAEAPLGYWNEGEGKLGFCHETGSFADRISGGYDGGCYGSWMAWGDPESDRVDRIGAVGQWWNRACNEVQWNRPR